MTNMTHKPLFGKNLKSNIFKNLKALILKFAAQPNALGPIILNINADLAMALYNVNASSTSVPCASEAEVEVGNS